jgi:hypothetical protein
MIVLFFRSFLVVQKVGILGHFILIILHQIINMHDQILNAFIILNIACGILYEIEILNNLKKFLIEFQILLVEVTLFVVEAVLEVHGRHSL